MPKQGKDFGCGANDLGFVLNPCKARYNYWVDAAATKFTATADSGNVNSIMAGCEKKDTWMIDEQKNLRATSDSVKICQ